RLLKVSPEQFDSSTPATVAGLAASAEVIVTPEPEKLTPCKPIVEYDPGDNRMVSPLCAVRSAEIRDPVLETMIST
ncbi:hypothetical protein, partial [Phenylobacterium sp.]|uniref:hypothetical protein n=1 Tax=Phenylobacterium sp. TaxID=1871053 RepID=UPI0025EACEBE